MSTTQAIGYELCEVIWYFRDICRHFRPQLGAQPFSFNVAEDMVGHTRISHRLCWTKDVSRHCRLIEEDWSFSFVCTSNGHHLCRWSGRELCTPCSHGAHCTSHRAYVLQVPSVLWMHLKLHKISKIFAKNVFLPSKQFFANILLILWSYRCIHWAKWSSHRCAFTGYSLTQQFLKIRSVDGK